MTARIKTLREKRGKLIDDMDGILTKAEQEKRDLTPEESKAWTDLKGQFEANDNTLLAMEQTERLKAETARPVGGDVVPLTAARRRYGKLHAFVGPGAEERAYRSGMFIRATIFKDAKADAWCREHGIAVVKAQSEGVNSEGGFLVPEEFVSTIIDNRETFGVFRQSCRVMPMGRDSMTVPVRSSGVTAYFTGEGATITASQMAFGQITLVAKKLAAYTLLSSELAEDAVVDIADMLADEIAYAFAEREDDCGFNGTGAGGTTYGGIRGVRVHIIDGTHTAGAIDAGTGLDTFAEITAADISNMMGALPQYALPRAAFYCSQPAFSILFERLAQAAGGNTIDTLSGAVRYRYLGYPIVISQKMPVSTGDLSNVAMILFGDLGRAVMLGDRRGVTIATSEHIKFAEDQIAIRGTERFDINVHSLGDNTTAGPIVALIGE